MCFVIEYTVILFNLKSTGHPSLILTSFLKIYQITKYSSEQVFQDSHLEPEITVASNISRAIKNELINKLVKN